MPVRLPDPAEEQALCRTLYRFATGIDRRDWALYRSVFTEQIDVDYTSYRPGSAGTMHADDWVSRARLRFTTTDATQHCLFNPTIGIDDDGSARLTMYLRAEHVLGSRWYTIGGYYEDRLVRAGDSWLINTKRLVVTWTRGDPTVLTSAPDPEDRSR